MHQSKARSGHHTKTKKIAFAILFFVSLFFWGLGSKEGLVLKALKPDEALVFHSSI